MPTYQGLEICLTAPNRVSVWESQVARPVDGIETPHANVVTTTIAPASERRTLTWGCGTRAERAALETFLSDLRGQLVACWMPDPQWQLAVVYTDGDQIDVAPGAAGELLEERITNDEAWRHWIGRVATSSDYTVRTFDVVTDNGDGTYSWHVASGVGPLVSNDLSAIYSRIYRCRMASDAYRVRYLTGNVTEISAEFVEVPG